MKKRNQTENMKKSIGIEVQKSESGFILTHKLCGMKQRHVAKRNNQRLMNVCLFQ